MQHVGPVMLLLATILLPRVWVASQAVAPNKDAIRYWAAADRFILQSPVDAIRSLDSLPVYPVMLALIKSAGWASSPELWWRSSQILGIASYGIFLVSAYMAGSMLVGPTRAWWGCTLVGLLPRQIRYSVDILSDNILAAFLWLALVLWWWVMDRSRSSGWLLGVSILLGLAALSRPEAYLWIGVLLIATLATRWGKGSGVLAFSMTCLVAPLIVIVGSYSFLRGEIAPSNTGRAMLGVTTAGERPDDVDPKTPFDAWIASSPNSLWSVAAAALVVAWEWAQETRVLLLLFFLVGLANVGLGGRQSRWLLLLLLLGTLVMLFWCRWKAGFLTSRYFMPILPIVGFSAVAGLEMLIDGLSKFAPRPRVARWAYAGAFAVTLLLSIPTLWEPMHADRSGHRQAANWLLRHTQVGEPVFDPSWVSAYFSGRPMTIPWRDSVPRYAVIDASFVTSPPLGLADAIDWAADGAMVAEFPRRSGSPDVGVRIYEMQPRGEAQRESTKVR
jgi:hypothetical protein